MLDLTPSYLQKMLATKCTSPYEVRYRLRLGSLDLVESWKSTRDSGRWYDEEGRIVPW